MSVDRLDSLAPDVLADDRSRPPSMLGQLSMSALLLALSGLGLGLFLALLGVGDLTEFAKKNELAREGRELLQLGAVIGSTSPVLAALLVFAARPTAQTVRRIHRVALGLTPCIGLPFLPYFFQWRVFDGHHDMLAVGGALFGLLMERAFRASFDAIGGGRLDAMSAALHALVPRAVHRFGPHLLLVAAAGLFGWHLCHYTILNHVALGTSAWDLAIFDNMMWNLLHGNGFKASPELGPEGSHLQVHANFIAVVLVPFYALAQRAETLLVIQGALVAGGAVPLYLIARRRLRSGWLALLIACLYMLFAPVQRPVFYDFHFLTLAPFFTLWVFYLFEARHRVGLLVALAAALAVREDQSAVIAAAAFLWLLSNQRPGWAMGIGLFSAAYFVTMKLFVMPRFGDGGAGESFTWMFRELIPQGESGFGAVIRTVLMNPPFALSKLLEWDKASYVLELLGPLLFLPVRHRRTWLLLLPAAVFTTLSTGYDPLVQTFFQYTSNWAPASFYATVLILDDWRSQPGGLLRTRAAVAALVLVGLVFSYNQGSLLQGNNFRGGFRKVQFSLTDDDRIEYRDLRALARLIPPDASVAATEMEAPHVSAREDCFALRYGHHDAEYLLVRTADVGRKGGGAHQHFSAAVRAAPFGLVAERGAFQLWRRGHESPETAAALKELGLGAAAPATPAPDARPAPATDEPATDEPATDEPATDKPATDKPATDAPAAAPPH